MSRETCTLPSSPSQRCIDRFSTLEPSHEDQDGTVPTWLLIERSLTHPVTSCNILIDIFESIAITLRGTTGPAGDYGTLRSVIESHRPKTFFSTTWPSIRRAALSLPRLFPTGEIAKLVPGEKLTLSREQCASLVAHQFLCSFDKPREDFFDFSVWYAPGQRHPVAVEMYLEALFTYFDTLSTTSNTNQEIIEYTLHSFQPQDTPKLQQPHLQTTPLQPIHITQVPKHSTAYQQLTHQSHNSALIISANRDIGFGQSATQEEVHVGNSPEASAAVLFTPRLAPEQVLTINHARPMLRIEGQRRDISWSYLTAGEQRGGRMLLMDALEMDEVDGEDGGGLPDLLPENIDRELKKAYTAFTSWKDTGGETAKIWTGLWGCGAFHGEPAVKALMLWIAASVAGKELYLLLDESEMVFADKLKRVAEKVSGVRAAGHLRSVLDSVPKDITRLGVLDWLDGCEQLVSGQQDKQINVQ